MSKTAEQIAKITEQQKQLENRKKELLSRQREEERKKRTKRLIERGAILESLIDNAETFTNEQIQAFWLIRLQPTQTVLQHLGCFGPIFSIGLRKHRHLTAFALIAEDLFAKQKKKLMKLAD